MIRLYEAFLQAEREDDQILIADMIQNETLKIYSKICGEAIKDAIEKRRYNQAREMRKWELLAKYVRKGGALLDCGFGSGRDLLIASRLGYKVFGCEACTKYYNDFIVSYPEYKGNLRHEDMRELSFNSEFFDIVRHNASFLHMPLIGPRYTIHKVFEESWRVLRHGGVMYIYTKAGNGFRLLDTGEGFGLRPFQYFTKDLLAHVLVESGFSVEYLAGIEKDRVLRQPDGAEVRKKIPWVEAIARKA